MSNADRYISQNALISEIAKIHGNLNTRNVGQAIWDTPTADVVEVVRCRDCLWWSDKGLDPILNRRDGKCGRPLGEYIDSVDFGTCENDYCSYGERKEK